jgi:hypothetical protein
VVELHDEGNLVGVLARHRAQHAERRGDAVAAAFDGQLHDVLRVEEVRVRREGGAGGVLDALVDGQQRQVARAGQAAVVEQRLQVAQHRRLAVGLGDDAVDEVRAGQMQPRRRDAAAFVLEKFVGLVAEQFDDVGHGASVLCVWSILPPPFRPAGDVAGIPRSGAPIRRA